MTSPAAWLAERRVPRILFVAGLFPFGLLGLLSAALVVMTAILRGWRLALEDCLAALLVLLALILVVAGSWQALVLSAGLSWGSAVLLGALAGRHASLTLPLQVLVLLGTAGVLLFAVLVGDPVAFWEPVLETLTAQLGELGLRFEDPGGLNRLAPSMTGLVAASAVVSSSLALVLGSWWAATAGGPRFATAFLGIRMGVVLGIIAALAGLAVLFGLGWLPASLLLVIGTGFAVQGIAVLHWQARARNWPWPVLAAVYLPLLFGPVLIALAWLIFAAVGFIDNWYGLRRGGTDVIK